MACQIVARYLWDGETGRTGPFAVSVEGDRIRAVAAPRGGPAGAPEILDYGEATILPGLVDMHTHLGINHQAGNIKAQMQAPPVRHILGGSQSLLADLASGVTTAKLNGDRDGFDVQFREAVRDGTAQGPRLLVSGRGIKSSRCTGGVVATAIADEAAAVGRAVDENLALTADWIKLFSSGGIFGPREDVLQPFYDTPQLSLATAKAHAAGKRISSHCFGGGAADACIAAGVDVIDHGWLLTLRQQEAMCARGVWLCPTVGVLLHPEGILPHVHPAERDLAKRRIAEVAETTARALRMGVPLLVGTDAMHGGLAFELKTLQELGGKPEALLRAATSHAAQALGLTGQIGAIQGGAPADMVVVRGNALADVGCLSEVLFVMQGGKRIALNTT
jgi:imidazolonepropionase-like amidohydrolase